MVIYPKWRSDLDILGRFICRLPILKNMVSCEACSGVTSWIGFKLSASFEVNNMLFSAWSWCIPCDGCPVIQLWWFFRYVIGKCPWNLHLVYGTYFSRKDWDCCFVPRMLWRQWFCANPEGAIQIRYYEEIACTCWCLWHGWGDGMYMLMFIFAWFSWNGCIVPKILHIEDDGSASHT